MSDQKQFDLQLADEVIVWEAALREGYNVRQMFEKTTAQPLAGEVQQVLAEVSAGTPFVDALKHWTQRNESHMLKLFVTTLLTQREIGGNLADMLQAVGAVMKQKLQE